MAHQLRQPLTVVSGYLELLLERRAALDPTTLAYLAEVQLAVQAIDDVVDRLHRATVFQRHEYPGGLQILDFGSDEFGIDLDDLSAAD